MARPEREALTAAADLWGVEGGPPEDQIQEHQKGER